MSGGVVDLQPTVSRDEVRRALGYPRRRRPAPAVGERLDVLWPTAMGLLRARGAYRVIDAAAAATAEVPRPRGRKGPELLALGLCTIGAGLEDEAQRRSDTDQPLDALILDAFGSAAAEAAADALCEQICAAARALGRWPSRRISPGYGRWDVRRQPQLLELLPADEVGVRLSSGMMMIPRKSISFAARLEARAPRATPRCAGCDLRSCAYRVDDRRAQEER
jgi:hypothetical protein